MLTSIILSMAISVTPTPIVDIQELGIVHGSIRINNTENQLDIEKTGRRRGSIRINNTENQLDIEKTGRRRGSIRI
ncbi:MAG: hypothetical protein COA59_00820 [Colwellia sp.]|nr:MAG: hypothetical protein COA59_00820 [Colwellia sp.]